MQLLSLAAIAALLACAGAAGAQTALDANGKMTAAPAAPLASKEAAQSTAAMQDVVAGFGPMQIHFGDDSGPNAFNGICDDPRFGGPMSYGGAFTDADAGHDALDCELNYYDGYVWVIPEASIEIITFGQDLGAGAYDGLCADPRFEGVGMAAALHLNPAEDATDCEDAWIEEFVSVRAAVMPDMVTMYGDEFTNENVPQFGDDTGPNALDGLCDDDRFGGIYATALGGDNNFRDASDCNAEFLAGELLWADDWAAGTGGDPFGLDMSFAYDFGDDAGPSAFNAQCNDPRFLSTDEKAVVSVWDKEPGHDATDCATAYDAYSVTVAPGYTLPPAQ